MLFSLKTNAYYLLIVDQCLLVLNRNTMKKSKFVFSAIMKNLNFNNQSAQNCLKSKWDDNNENLYSKHWQNSQKSLNESKKSLSNETFIIQN